MYDGSGTQPGLPAPPPQGEEVEAYSWAAPSGWAGSLGWVGILDSAGTLDCGLEGWSVRHTGCQGTCWVLGAGYSSHMGSGYFHQ